jgi:Arylsulfotransferase (ASST)
MKPPRIAARAGVVGLALLMLAVAGDESETTPTSVPVASPEPATVAGRTFMSRPDLSAPLIQVAGSRASRQGDRAALGDPVFLAPKDGGPITGPLIVDADGEPVWIHPLEDTRAYDLRVQEYEGEPVLTWWRGQNLGIGYGFGDYVIMDRSYRVIAKVTTRGSSADHHGMTLTDDGTALLITYRKMPRDLTALGGPEDGWVVDCVVQEIDVATGKVVFSWSGIDHVPIADTKIRIGPYTQVDGTFGFPLDYLHVNSVTEDDDGSLLISARNTHAVYRVDRETGEVDWVLGGSASDFRMLGNAEFAWQHDAQRQPDGTITLFDNEAGPAVGEQSRGLRLDLDVAARTARVVTEYLPPDGRLSSSQGNLYVRDNGNVFIGWGGLPFYSEYARDGELLLDAQLLGGASYRAFRMPWIGEPTEPPALAVDDGTAYVSWNGATEVAAWRFLAGADAASAKVVATTPRTGFETSAPVPDEPYVAVQALDADGRVLATAEPGMGASGTIWP